MLIMLKRIWFFVPYIWNLLWSKDVPFKSKLAFIFGGLYLVSFIDLIPDLIPFFGLIDDVFITSFLVYLGLLGVPKSVLDTARKLVTKKVTIEPIK
jgi:uncharacterized membrane protein YkvA (DUF1232 family)